jgi:type IV pilus assembly protein PilC
MPTYQYEAMNAQGQEVKDSIEALSTEEAISKIRNLGFFPTKIKERGATRRGAKKATGAAGDNPRSGAAPGARYRSNGSPSLPDS